jgi:hypothetical protein
MKLSKKAFLALAALVIAVMACSQAGEVLTPEDATQRAITAADVTAVPTVSSSESGIQVGDRVRFASKEYLVLMKRDPGSPLIAVQSERGASGTVLNSQDVDGADWYQVETIGGIGWVPGNILEVVSGEGQAEFLAGDTAFLTGPSETVKLLVAPGNNLGAREGIAGNQVTILQSTVFEGDTWYKVQAPAGEGWVLPVNLTVEAP